MTEFLTQTMRSTQNGSCLKCLDLGRGDTSDDVKAAIITLATKHPELVGVGFQNSCFNAPMKLRIVNALSLNKRLIHLAIFRCKLSDTAGPAIENLLRTNRILKSVQFLHSVFSDIQFINISNAFSHNTSITHFDVWHSPLTDCSGPAISNLLNTNKTLQALQLTNCTFTDTGFVEVLQALASNVALTNFDICASRLTDNSVSSIAKLVWTNRVLQQFMLLDSQLSDSGFCMLADALTKNTSMQCFVIKRSKLSDTSVPTLRKLVLTKKLQALVLDGSSAFSDQHLIHLAQLFVSLGNIQCVRIGAGCDAHIPWLLAMIRHHADATKISVSGDEDSICLRLTCAKEVTEYTTSAVTIDVTAAVPRIVTECEATSITHNSVKLPTAHDGPLEVTLKHTSATTEIQSKESAVAQSAQQSIPESMNLNLRRNWLAVLKDLQPGPVCDYLIHTLTFDLDEVDEIKLNATRKEQASRLLEKIIRKSRKDFKHFIDALQDTEQLHLADLFVNNV